MWHVNNTTWTYSNLPTLESAVFCWDDRDKIVDKFMHVVLTNAKTEEDWTRGMIECLHQMGEKTRDSSC